MKTHIIIELKLEEKKKIKKASTKLSIGHSTFCRMVSLKEANKILAKEKNAKSRN